MRFMYILSELMFIFHFNLLGKTMKTPEKKIPIVDSVEQSQTKRTDREKA